MTTKEFLVAADISEPTLRRWLKNGQPVPELRDAEQDWRGWHNWRAAVGGNSWLAQSGAEGSLAAGAVVLGYYVIYWAGVRRRLRAR